MDALNIVSCACALFLLLSYAILPKQATRRSLYTISYAFSVAALTSTGFYSIGDVTRVACSDNFTMANQYTNGLCLVQGASFIWGLTAVITWSKITMSNW